MELYQTLTRTITEEIDYTNTPPEIVDRLRPLKSHEQEWGIREYHNGENIDNILDSIEIYNNNIRDNRYNSILVRHNRNYKNIFNYTSRIIHSALTEFEELRAPKPSNRKLQESHRNWSIEEPPYSEILVDNNRLRIVKVQRADDTGKAAKIASDMSHKSEWCTVNVGKADDYLSRGNLYFILLDGEKYLYHAEAQQLMDFGNRPFRISEEVYYLLSDYIPDIGLFMEDEHSEIYKNAAIKYPLVACMYARDVLRGRWPEAESIIMKDPLVAYNYAVDTIKSRWFEAEPAIMKYPKAACVYAYSVLRGRWIEAEPIIIQDPWSAAHYTHHVLKRRWPGAEPIIMKDPDSACDYAIYVLKRRWPEAEPNIMKNAGAATNYAINILERRWLEVEPIIMKDPWSANHYARYVLERRWPEAEPIIMNDHWAAFYYARDVLKREWPEAEPNIMKNPGGAHSYAKYILKRRWPEAEPNIMKDPNAAKHYKEDFDI